MAAETLDFKSTIPRSSLEKIKSYSFKTLQKNSTPLEIAKIDLNRDGLHEFITRPRVCGNENICDFNVLAETDQGIVVLGHFKGANILLGNEFQYGVRNLLVFGNSMNDFDYTLYTWHPEVSAYRKGQP